MVFPAMPHHRYLTCFTTVFAGIVIAGWLLVWFLHILAIFHGLRTLHRKRVLTPNSATQNAGNESGLYSTNNPNEAPSELPPSYEVATAQLPGVSIIKPLVGVDQNLATNLESFFVLDYPEFELLFCVRDVDDPAILLVQQLREKYPRVPSALFVGGADVGVNPKINNMHPAYCAAKYDFILISDSGIKMKADTLTDMMQAMRPDVALVHQMPFACDRTDSFPSILEKVYFGTAHARIYLSADCLGFNCPTGMSALMRKRLLDEVGGIAAFGGYLAEDFFFAKSFTDRGWKLSMASQPAWQNAAPPDIESFQNRITRWAKLRIAMVPHVILLEPLSECFVLGALASWAMAYLFPHYDPFAFYLFHILFWFLLDYTLLKTVQRSELPFSKIDFVAAWLIRELFALVLFARALTEPNIVWRTRTFRLKWGGFVEEVKDGPNIVKSKPPLASIPNTEKAQQSNAQFALEGGDIVKSPALTAVAATKESSYQHMIKMAL